MNIAGQDYRRVDFGLGAKQPQEIAAQQIVQDQRMALCGVKMPHLAAVAQYRAAGGGGDLQLYHQSEPVPRA